ncbi:uncharacterized protein LOC133518191 [Cydia pomonella]|uniref:uncharacterized protein LOC133518191 n=1 Tax=Cydia pomonella TaxID=82600 RepID=UPI002ADDCF42|nr:uncharacterized protein LOC133518191 [Cydia pomonella]
MSIAINKLISLGAIKKCDPRNDQYISNTFLVPKPNGSSRFILNLKSFNKFVTKSHFKMEDYRTASKLIPHNGFLATIDLKEAYLLIPVREADRKYLRFQFVPHGSNETEMYEFTAMPYGLSVAPKVFTKIMKEVVTHLRKQGFKSVVYLDDICCIGDSYDECLNNVNATVNLFETLGFIINNDKSVLQPSQICKFLGFIFDSRNLTIGLPQEKREKIYRLVSKFMKLPRCTIREYAQLIGVLISACPATNYGWLYTKLLERHKFLSLKKHQDNYEAKINLPETILDDLCWWKDNIYTTSSHMRTSSFKLEIYTDASRTGWGSVCGDITIGGHWKAAESEHHINYLELLAVFLGLKSFALNETNCFILLRIDNTTAISYINRMGGIQFPYLNDLSRQIWQWCEMRDIILYASYVNTKDNRADEASRKSNPDTEWELSNQAFQTIVRRFGQPEIDIFASRSNTKCDKFVSWFQEPDAFAVDAFTLNWSQHFFYAFPPFCLLLKCIRKIIDDNATDDPTACTPALPWLPRRYQHGLLPPRRSARSDPISFSLAFGEHKNFIKITIPDLIKTSAPGREQPLLNIPYFRENLSICPALTLKDYILVTQNKRARNHGALLLTHKAPHRAATSQTVGRWIRQVLAAAGVDVSTFGAHSTRHASTSAARAAGVSIEVIRKAAGWTAKSQTFSKYYDRPLKDGNNDEFAKAACFGRNMSD